MVKRARQMVTMLQQSGGRASLIHCWISKCVQHGDVASLNNWSCRNSEKWAGDMA